MRDEPYVWGGRGGLDVEFPTAVITLAIFIGSVCHSCKIKPSLFSPADVTCFQTFPELRDSLRVPVLKSVIYENSLQFYFHRNLNLTFPLRIDS